MPKTREIVNRNLLTVPVSTTLAEAASLLSRTEVGAALVLDASGVPVGMVTQADLARTLGEDLADLPTRGPWDLDGDLDDLVPLPPLDPSVDLTVGDVMQAEVPMVSGDLEVPEAARQMALRGSHYLVVEDSGRLVGLLSALDVLASLAAPPPLALVA